MFGATVCNPKPAIDLLNSVGVEDYQYIYRHLPKVSYFIFSLEKILSHSLTPFRDLRYFFFPDPEKKNTVQKFQIIQVWASEPW